MADDAIRAALEKAQQAYCNGMTADDCECARGARAQPCAADWIVRATIAAFLRASVSDLSAIAPLGDGSTTVGELAAAVERAAKEDRS